MRDTKPVTPAGRVLVADDDRQIREFVRAALEDEGYEVLTAADGARAGAGAGGAAGCDPAGPEHAGHGRLVASTITPTGVAILTYQPRGA